MGVVWRWNYSRILNVLLEVLANIPKKEKKIVKVMRRGSEKRLSLSGIQERLVEFLGGCGDKESCDFPIIMFSVTCGGSPVWDNYN